MKRREGARRARPRALGREAPELGRGEAEEGEPEPPGRRSAVATVSAGRAKTAMIAALSVVPETSGIAMGAMPAQRRLQIVTIMSIAVIVVATPPSASARIQSSTPTPGE